jgi:hypothetical protein
MRIHGGSPGNNTRQDLIWIGLSQSVIFGYAIAAGCVGVEPRAA